MSTIWAVIDQRTGLQERFPTQAEADARKLVLFAKSGADYRVRPVDGDDGGDEVGDCDNCDGTGVVPDNETGADDCRRCDGTGWTS